ncbi:MAG: allophanate hydrolase subunit 1 [Actinomycetia bacterium]|nr:allophanate hydrolase subunit 1 [Actinomycetes bacterium]
MKLLPYGDRALLAEFGDIEAVVAWSDGVRHADLDDVLDVVPAARTVLVVARSGVDLGVLRRSLDAIEPRVDGSAGEHATTVDVPVHYDGVDLAAVSAVTGLAEPEVVRAHTGTPWRVAFGGFAPGFAYLSGGDPRLRVPRRDEARTSVPAGAVGLAGEFSGIYPRPSPGGWQLIGTTDEVMWDLDRDPPALLSPGCIVRFFDAGGAA